MRGPGGSRFPLLLLLHDMCGRREGEGPSHAWPEMRTTGRGMAAHGSGWGLPCRLTRGYRKRVGAVEGRESKKEMRELWGSWEGLLCFFLWIFCWREVVFKAFPGLHSSWSCWIWSTTEQIFSVQRCMLEILKTPYDSRNNTRVHYFGSKGIDWEPESDKVTIVAQGIFWSSCSYMWKMVI